MRPGERRSRKANFESLDEAGNTAHVHIKRVARTKYREPLRIRRSHLEELVSEVRARGTASWSGEEKKLIAITAKAWVLLAPLGVETSDIRRLVDKAVRNAWK